MIHLNNFLILTFITAFVLSTSLLASPLKGDGFGPMVGDVTETSFQLWYLVKDKGNARLSVKKLGENGAKTTEPVIFLEKAEKYDLEWATYKGKICKLEIESNYIVEFRSGDWLKIDTISTLGENLIEKDMTFLYGSCNMIPNNILGFLIRPTVNKRIYKSMLNENAQSMFWLGDNIYYKKGDVNFLNKMFLRNLNSRKVKPYRDLLFSCPQYSIWDDHDFGPNNAGADFIKKDESLTLFNSFWVNPEVASKTNSGVYFNYQIGDVEWFMLDNRFYNKVEEGKEKENVVFGDEQINWLKGNLITSTAKFKIIVGGMQILTTYGEAEGLHEAPMERNEILEFIEKEQLKGIVLLSGDRHFAEMYKMKREGTYDLWEFTSSPISSTTLGLPFLISSKKDTLSIDKTRFWKQNYGKIEILNKGIERLFKLSIHNKKGKLVWFKELSLKDLGY